MGADDFEFELAALEDELDEEGRALLGRLRRHRRPMRRPGQPAQQYPVRWAGAGVPDFNAASLPWHHPDIMGLLPSGWGQKDFEIAIRHALSQPMYRLTTRASFTGTAGEQVTAQFSVTNRNFLGHTLWYSKSNPDVSVAARVNQNEKYPLSSDTRVRLEALFGGTFQAGAAKPL